MDIKEKCSKIAGFFYLNAKFDTDRLEINELHEGIVFFYFLQ